MKKYTKQSNKKNSQTNKTVIHRFFSRLSGIQLVAILFLLFSVVVLLINAFIFKYPGNLYFPSSGLFDWLLILLIWAGSVLQFGKNSKIAHITKEVFYFYLLILIISIGSTAIQFTPFPPIDKKIQLIESIFYVNMDEIVKWTNSFPAFYTFLTVIYSFLTIELIVLPICIIIARQSDYFYEFVFLVLISTFIGFVFYYFFPTTAPASISTSPYFTDEQRATGLKFYQIHHYIEPTTILGGMVALPSFHVIWSWWLQFMTRVWPLVFYFLLPLNIMLIFSCVLLGWHYPIDIIGSIIIILCTHYIYNKFCNYKKLPKNCFIKKTLN